MNSRGNGFTNIKFSWTFPNQQYTGQSPLCQTCLSPIHGLCRSDHPFLNISHILHCISKLFMSNSVITKTGLYRRGFSFLKLVFRLNTTACVENFVLVKKLNNMNVKVTLAFNSVQFNILLRVIAI